MRWALIIQWPSTLSTTSRWILVASSSSFFLPCQWCAFISIGTMTVADRLMVFYLVNCVNPGYFKFISPCQRCAFISIAMVWCRIFFFFLPPLIFWCVFADCCQWVLSADHSMVFYLVDHANPDYFMFLSSLALSTVHFHLFGSYKVSDTRRYVFLYSLLASFHLVICCNLQWPQNLHPKPHLSRPGCRKNLSAYYCSNFHLFYMFMYSQFICKKSTEDLVQVRIYGSFTLIY